MFSRAAIYANKYDIFFHYIILLKNNKMLCICCFIIISSDIAARRTNKHQPGERKAVKYRRAIFIAERHHQPLQHAAHDEHELVLL